jgi:cellulose synthase/poly-beta-1,6-N-acetylglucosamine synthase-like glycosyltransferase
MNSSLVSVVIPARNEEKNVEALWRSLLAQTLYPSEIIFVDGGSTDRTIAIIREFMDGNIPVRLIEAGNALPGRGRNIGISAAHGEILAMTDAGIVLAADWLKCLVEPFEREPDVQVVYGVHGCYTQTLFERCYATVNVPRGKKVGARYYRYPCPASMAIRRSAWEKTGGFREDLRADEDILFFRHLEKLGLKTVLAPEAVAYWRPRSSLKEACLLKYKYAVCDGLTGIHVLHHVRKALLYVLCGFFFLAGLGDWRVTAFLTAGFLINLLLACKKNWGDFLGLLKEGPRSIFLIGQLILLGDVAALFGFFFGLMLRGCRRIRTCIQR